MYGTQQVIRLYAWQPEDHGAYSFFVAAESEEAAIKAVENHMAENEYIGDYETDGWLTDSYTLTVLPIGVAISNANE